MFKRATEARQQIKPGLTMFAFLKTNVLFSNCKDAEIKEACTFFEVKTYDKGEMVVKEGDIGDRLYIIADGLVQFTRSGDSNQKHLRKLGKGEVFGEFSFVHNAHLWNKNAVVESLKLITLEMTRETFEEHSESKAMNTLRERVQQAKRILVQNGLKDIPFLKGFPEDKLISISSYFEFQAIPNGFCLYKEGSVGDRFYILLSGELVLTTIDDLGFPLEIARIDPIGVFGEAALVEKRQHTTSATAMVDSTILYMEQGEFYDFLSQVPTLRDKLLRSVKDADFAKYVTERIPIFKQMTPRHKHLLVAVSKTVSFPKGTVIKQEGSSGNRSFYIVIEGELTVTRNGDFKRSLKRGDYFGEVGLISQVPSSATVKVTDESPCTCVAISQESFSNVIIDEPSIEAEMSIKLLGPECSLADILMHPIAKESFLKHCEKEFARENVDFWQDVKALEKVDKRRTRKSVVRAIGLKVPEVREKKLGQLKARAKNIIEKYFNEDLLNISGDISESIREKARKGEYSFDMFEQAQKEVFSMIEADNFSRYKKSDAFREMLAKIGTYDT